MASTPWGSAELIDEIVLSQTAGDDAFATHVQLLETKQGERLVRLAYATTEQPTVRRGPVTLRLGDLARLRREFRKHHELAAAFALDGSKPRRPSAPGPRRRASPG
jgi:hypothetical protein